MCRFAFVDDIDIIQTEISGTSSEIIQEELFIWSTCGAIVGETLTSWLPTGIGEKGEAHTNGQVKNTTSVF